MDANFVGYDNRCLCCASMLAFFCTDRMEGAICVSACTDVGLWGLLAGGGYRQGEGGT